MAHWTFLINHAQVLICVARDERPTAEEIAAVVGITERAVQRLLDDLAESDHPSLPTSRRYGFRVGVAIGPAPPRHERRG